MTGRSPSGRACGPSDLSRDASQPEALVPNALIAKVLDYYEGRKPYDFYRLTDDFDRSNQAFDAWQEIAGEIRAHLGRDKKMRRKKAQGIEAQRATTENTGVVHESPVPQGCAQTQSSTHPHRDNKEAGL